MAGGPARTLPAVKVTGAGFMPEHALNWPAVTAKCIRYGAFPAAAPDGAPL